MKKSVVITSLAVVGIATFGYLYMKRPKGTILINADGSGVIKLGNKSANFEKGNGAVIKTWNGWQLSGSASNRALSRFGKTYEEGAITEFDLGTSNIEIIFNK
jgi:hypothetical protein